MHQQNGRCRGVLRLPGAEAAWPNSAACWSPAMPQSGSARPKSVNRHGLAGRLLDGRTRCRARAAPSARGPQTLWRMSNSIVRDALLTIGGMHRAAGQLPQPVISAVPKSPGSPCAARPRARRPSRGPAASAAGSRKVRVDAQAGGMPTISSSPCARAAARRRLSAPVLPDDGVVQRLARAPVPQQRSRAGW